MTYSEVLQKAEDNGQNLAYLALGRMMDYVEEQTGKWPRWTDEAPEWIVRNMLGGVGRE